MMRLAGWGTKSGVARFSSDRGETCKRKDAIRDVRPSKLKMLDPGDSTCCSGLISLRPNMVSCRRDPTTLTLHDACMRLC